MGRRHFDFLLESLADRDHPASELVNSESVNQTIPIKIRMSLSDVEWVNERRTVLESQYIPVDVRYL